MGSSAELAARNAGAAVAGSRSRRWLRPWLVWCAVAVAIFCQWWFLTRAIFWGEIYRIQFRRAGPSRTVTVQVRDRVGEAVAGVAIRICGDSDHGPGGVTDARGQLMLSAQAPSVRYLDVGEDWFDFSAGLRGHFFRQETVSGGLHIDAVRR